MASKWKWLAGVTLALGAMNVSGVAQADVSQNCNTDARTSGWGRRSPGAGLGVRAGVFTPAVTEISFEKPLAPHALVADARR